MVYTILRIPERSVVVWSLEASCSFLVCMISVVVQLNLHSIFALRVRTCFLEMDSVG